VDTNTKKLLLAYNYIAAPAYSLRYANKFTITADKKVECLNLCLKKIIFK